MVKQRIKGVFILIMLSAIFSRFWGCDTKPIPKITEATPTIFQYAEAAPDSTVRVLFIHHSCGGNWVADPGVEQPLPGVETGTNLYLTHENGGGLRTALSQITNSLGAPAYELHETGRKSIIGAETNVCHWYPKFSTLFDAADSSAVDMLNVDVQDQMYADSGQNEIIMFKSCYPNSNVETGDATENPLTDETRTLGNYQAVYQGLLRDIFRPEREGRNRALFIVITAPPEARKNTKDKFSKVAREFNNWLRTEWLAEDDVNVAVFDYYNVNTGGIGNDLDGSWVQGSVNHSAYSLGGDSHPTREAQQVATREFVRFINLAYNRWKGNLAVPKAEVPVEISIEDTTR